MKEIIIVHKRHIINELFEKVMENFNLEAEIPLLEITWLYGGAVKIINLAGSEASSVKIEIEGSEVNVKQFISCAVWLINDEKYFNGKYCHPDAM